MREKLKAGDRVQNKETKLVGTLKQHENEGLYYVEGEHELAGKWVTGNDKLRAFEKSWAKY